MLDALRRGAVPAAGLDLLAVGLDRFERVAAEDLAAVAAGGSVFKAVRGEYGSGKTFVTRWLAERAKKAGLATAEVQISENETPLHRLETVYRRLTERLTTATFPPSALRQVVDGWFYALEEDILAADEATGDDAVALDRAVGELVDRRLADVGRTAPAFAAALRGYRAALAAGDEATAAAVLAWLGGPPHVATSARRTAGARGDLDHFGALGFLLLLAGRSWRVTHIDWKRRRCFVEPAEGGGRARWLTPADGALSFELTRAMREILLGADPPVPLTRRATRRLAVVRENHLDVVHPGGTMIIRTEDLTDVRWWTWAGERANRTLTASLGDLTDPLQAPTASYLRLRTDLTPPRWKAATADLESRLCLPHVTAEALAGLKFNTALPPHLAEATLATRLADLPAATTVLREPVRFTTLGT